MSIALLTAAVPAGQQLPGGMFDFNETATPANAAWFGSADNSVIPAYGNGNFVIGGTCRYGIVQGNRYLITHYLNAQNFFAIRHNGTSNTLELILFTSNAVDVVASVALHTLSCSVRWMAWRDGNTWGIAVLKGQFESTYPEILIATAGPQSGKTGNTHGTIEANASSRYYLGSLNGTTANTTNKWIGAIGLTFEIALGSETLADYALGTDAQKEAVLYDFQKLFSVCGFTPSQLLAWGNWADSSGNLKATIGTSQFAASDRVVCPFSGKYLTLGAGAANANELVYPPYTEPAHTQPLQAWRGSGNDIDLPSAIESPSGEGLIVYRTQKDQSANPAFFLDFVKYGESVNRWPIPLNVPYQFIDAAPVANARGISYNGIAGATAIGDTHVAMPLIPVYDTDGTVKAILCSIYWHSTQRPNVPTTGDRQLDAGVLIVIDDDGQRVVDLVPMPWGSAYTGNEDAYLLGVNTYSLMINRAFKTMIATRSGAATGADILEVMFDPETETTDYKKVINGGGGVLRSYPGQAVIMSDGRMIRCGLYLKVETGASSITGYTAWIVPPAADFADNSKWFAPTGQRLDGTDGISALGSINFLSTNALHLTSDNDAFFPDLPDLSEGMDALFMLHPCHVNGPTFEGMAAVMRISTTNADRSSITSDSNGGAWLPYDKCVIRRWIYTTGSAPTLVEERDELDALVEFDLMPILEAMLPGNWGRDTNFLAAEVTGLSAMQFGTNKMLLFIHDNLTATPGTNLIPTNLNTGHRLRAVLFHDLSAADPTENLEFGEIVFDLATDNSEGYGLYPYFAGSGNDGSKSVCVYVGGGTWASEGYGNRNAHAVDLRTNFRETQPLAIADMVNITNKRVFDEELNSGATSDEEMETYLGLRTVNSEVNDYDWSGFQLGTYAASYNGNGYNHSVPCTLISDTYGISANHNVPVVGAKVWFRTPVGTIVETTVADTTELTLSGSYLVQLDSNPSVLLERYPIVRDASLQRYVAAGGKFWQFYQTLAIKLRECVSLTTHSGLAVVEHADSDWEQGDILSGSGRPAVVPLNDGTLVLIGTAEYGGSGQFHGNNRFSLDFVEIQSTLAASGESATFMDIPGYPSDSLAASPGYAVGNSIAFLPGASNPALVYLF